MRPATAATQKPREGFSPARRTANTAVQAGSSAITTAPWEESTSRSASAVSSGKPTTTPNAMMHSERHCSRVGRGACQTRSTITAKHRGHRGAPEGDEHRVEVGDREAGRGEREREHRDAERGQEQAAQLVVPGGCRYRG